MTAITTASWETQLQILTQQKQMLEEQFSKNPPIDRESEILASIPKTSWTHKGESRLIAALATDPVGYQDEHYQTAYKVLQTALQLFNQGTNLSVGQLKTCHTEILHAKSNLMLIFSNLRNHPNLALRASYAELCSLATAALIQINQQ